MESRISARQYCRETIESCSCRTRRPHYQDLQTLDLAACTSLQNRPESLQAERFGTLGICVRQFKKRLLGAIAGQSGANRSGNTAKVGSSIIHQTGAFHFKNSILRIFCAGQSLQLSWKLNREHMISKEKSPSVCVLP